MLGFLKDLVIEFLELRAARARAVSVGIPGNSARGGPGAEPTGSRTAPPRLDGAPAPGLVRLTLRVLGTSAQGWLRLLDLTKRRLNPSPLIYQYFTSVSNVLVALALSLFLLVGGIHLQRNRHMDAEAMGRPTPVVVVPARAAPQPARPRPAATEEPGPTRLTIPSIRLDTDVVDVGWTRVVNASREDNVWETANYAAGYHHNSALPGQGGNTVISGHNNILGSVFQDLHKLEPGQRVLLYSGQKERVYEVVENFVVQEEGASLEARQANAAWIAPTDDERLTLVTCYPPWSNTHRTIVIARPVNATRSPAIPDTLLEP